MSYLKYAYVSGITNDSFCIGLLIMFRSLNQVCLDRSIERVCFVTENVSHETRRRIEKEYIHCIETEVINVNASGRWKTTFQKLVVFSFTQYDRIVWIDADMIVTRNLDDLFEKPHMSCVRSRAPMLTRGGVLI